MNNVSVLSRAINLMRYKILKINLISLKIQYKMYLIATNGIEYAKYAFNHYYVH